MVVSIDANICQGIDACPTASFNCVEICALHAVDTVDGRPVITTEECNDCGLCALNCPRKAISKT